MTTVMIIVCIVACAGVILAIVGHLGTGIALDRTWRERIERHHAWRRRWSRQTHRVTG
jgi:adenosyl cobinamide kinase/adenosyl cobinamide phosphate guanylyltransferase